MWKVPKGTSDLTGKEYQITHRLIKTIEQEFIKHGGQPLETPVFERKDVLLGKYGEEAETKLIYNLADEGGELLALRYDLTIPFIRYIKENGIGNMRRYAIGKVYRRDQPNKNQGRLREFYQADFDIVGEKQDTMIAEGILLKIACIILNKYNIEYSILINDVKNLKTLLTEELKYEGDWKKLCPIIDKLDKQSFESLKSEFMQVDTNLNINKLNYKTISYLKILNTFIYKSSGCSP
jgi:histidyl-tRNA synthetase